MRKVKRFVLAAWAVWGLLPVAADAAVVVLPNLNVGPSVPPPGFPNFTFDDAIRVTLTKTGQSGTTSNSVATFDMRAEYNPGGKMAFQYDDARGFDVNQGSAVMTGRFSFTRQGTLTTLAFLGGNLEIKGTIPRLDIPKLTPPDNDDLYRASLTAFAANTTGSSQSNGGGSQQALGFRAEVPQGWASRFQSSPESFYIYNINAASVVATFGNKKLAVGQAVTWNNVDAIVSVPLPPALWLFGSAVAWMGWRTRGRAAHSEP